MTGTLHQAMRYDKRGYSPQLRFNTYKGSDGIWTVHRQECLCHWTMHTDRSVCATTAAADVINCKWLKLAPPLEPISHSERQPPCKTNPQRIRQPLKFTTESGKIRCNVVRPAATATKTKPSNEAATANTQTATTRMSLTSGI